jgi:hypothetical protein
MFTPQELEQKIFLIAIVTVLFSAFFVAFFVPQGHAELSEDSAQSLRAFLVSVNIESSLTQQIIDEFNAEMKDTESAFVSVGCSDSERNTVIEMTVRVFDGTVLKFSRLNSTDTFYESGIEKLEFSDAISKSEIVDKLEDLLELVVPGVGAEQLDFTLGDIGSLKSEDDLSGGFWDIRHAFELDGLPCRKSGIRIMASAYTGEVYIVKNVPRQRPESISREISKEEARRAGEMYLENATYFSGKAFQVTTDEELIDKVIAPRNHYFEFLTKAGPTPTLEVTRLCWEVPFTFVERGHTFSGELWIDIENGECIGGL